MCLDADRDDIQEVVTVSDQLSWSSSNDIESDIDSILNYLNVRTFLVFQKWFESRNGKLRWHRTLTRSCRTPLLLSNVVKVSSSRGLAYHRITDQKITGGGKPLPTPGYEEVVGENSAIFEGLTGWSFSIHLKVLSSNSYRHKNNILYMYITYDICS